MWGTFANIRIKNEMVPGVEGGVTKHIPSGEVMAIYDASMKYQKGRDAVSCRCRERVWDRIVA